MNVFSEGKFRIQGKRKSFYAASFLEFIHYFIGEEGENHFLSQDGIKLQWGKRKTIRKMFFRQG